MLDAGYIVSSSMGWGGSGGGLEVKRTKKAKNVTENSRGFENIRRKVWEKNSPAWSKTQVGTDGDYWLLMGVIITFTTLVVRYSCVQTALFTGWFSTVILIFCCVILRSS